MIEFAYILFAYLSTLTTYTMDLTGLSFDCVVLDPGSLALCLVTAT